MNSSANYHELIIHQSSATHFQSSWTSSIIMNSSTTIMNSSSTNHHELISNLHELHQSSWTHPPTIMISSSTNHHKLISNHHELISFTPPWLTTTNHPWLLPSGPSTRGSTVSWSPSSSPSSAFLWTFVSLPSTCLPCLCSRVWEKTHTLLLFLLLLLHLSQAGSLLERKIFIWEGTDKDFYRPRHFKWLISIWLIMIWPF